MTISQSAAALAVRLPRAVTISISATSVLLASPTLSESVTRQFTQTAFIAGIPAGGLAAILFDYNNGTIVIGVGGAVAFNQAPLIAGTAITKTNDTTFTVHADGIYRVSYTLRTALVVAIG